MIQAPGGLAATVRLERTGRYKSCSLVQHKSIKSLSLVRGLPLQGLTQTWTDVTDSYEPYRLLRNLIINYDH
jgi:hypothetical protein